SWGKSRASTYLEQRGITLSMARASLIGMNPTAYRATWGEVEVWLPRGIVIPWEIDQQIYNVRVRRPDADLAAGGDKYISPKGSANGLYSISMVRPGDTVVMTEGEFDALVLMRGVREAQLQR